MKSMHSATHMLTETRHDSQMNAMRGQSAGRGARWHPVVRTALLRPAAPPSATARFGHRPRNSCEPGLGGRPAIKTCIPGSAPGRGTWGSMPRVAAQGMLPP